MSTLSACPVNLVVDNHTFGSVIFPLKNDKDSIVTGILAAFNNEQYGKPKNENMILEQPSENKNEQIIQISEPTQKIELMNNTIEKKEDFFNKVKKNPERYKTYKIIMIILLIVVVFGILEF